MLLCFSKVCTNLLATSPTATLQLFHSNCTLHATIVTMVTALELTHARICQWIHMRPSGYNTALQCMSETPKG